MKYFSLVAPFRHKMFLNKELCFSLLTLPNRTKVTSPGLLLMQKCRLFHERFLNLPRSPLSLSLLFPPPSQFKSDVTAPN
uniref:Uncharacterized protein n=1 Tax=Arundo donax TaxID=35708 RepID=A0A0A9DN25_ARUDO